ncbi:MAG: hypothetical protein MJY59_05180 [Bacteroidaceae bacterium]|nr:hypothetical protein [Bacteroidaceae bacterium]
MRNTYSKPCIRVHAVAWDTAMLAGSPDIWINIGRDKDGDNTAECKEVADEYTNSIWD